MKQKDGGSNQGKGSPSYTAAQKLALKRANKNRDDGLYKGMGQTAKNYAYGSGQLADPYSGFGAYTYADSDVYKRGWNKNYMGDKYLQGAVNEARRGRQSQTDRAYSSWTNDEGIGGINQVYEADNKGVSATRGRRIAEEAKYYQRSEGMPKTLSYKKATKEFNAQLAGDVTMGSVGRQGSKAWDKFRGNVNDSYDQENQKRWQAYFNKTNASERAEIKRTKKAQQRGDLGRGSGASQGFYEKNVRGK